MSKRILYAVSSVGLGHIRRSVVIARELEDLEVNWIAAEPALSYLKSVGEKNILGVSEDLRSMSSAMEGEALNGTVSDMSRVARVSSRIAKENYFLIRPYLKDYDALIEDEFAETMFSFLWDKEPPLPKRVAVITDYLRFETPSMNPVNRLVLYYANRLLKRSFLAANLRMFADDIDSLPVDQNLRRFASDYFTILGPIIGGIPSASKEELRARLLLGKNRSKVIVFSIGGTGIGRPLLDFVLANANELSERLDASLVALTGPRSGKFEGSTVQIVPFTTEALAYFKMADCVVTQAGASTLNEVATLGVPCVSVPIKNHWEQQVNAKRFHDKLNFGVLQYEQLSVGSIVSEIKHAISSQKGLERPAEEPQKRAAKLIMDLCR